ncbi:MAG TPA: hypothetical protein VES89_07940 [Candidatus Competibacteraceae bacterium]|nr:hypothetical protein [Candidatus Competibacteraceae bacterium]
MAHPETIAPNDGVSYPEGLRHSTRAGVSPGWRWGVILTLVVGFAVLLWMTARVYVDAPPIPQRVVGPAGETVFTSQDILAGQEVFLKYGLMENGTIWGHGAYLGPDFSAQYLHNLAVDTGQALAQQRWGRDFASLSPPERELIFAEVRTLLKGNRYDPATQTLVLTAPEVASYRHQIDQWAAYFQQSGANRGLPSNISRTRPNCAN